MRVILALLAMNTGGPLMFWALGAVVLPPEHWWFPFRVAPVLTLGLALSALGWLALLDDRHGT